MEANQITARIDDLEKRVFKLENKSVPAAASASLAKPSGSSHVTVTGKK